MSLKFLLQVPGGMDNRKCLRKYYVNFIKTLRFQLPNDTNLNVWDSSQSLSQFLKYGQHNHPTWNANF